MRRIVQSAILVAICAYALRADTIYTNQTQWQNAMAAQGYGPLLDVSFANADWTSSFSASQSYDALTSESSTAAGPGLTITAVSGYSPIGIANNALLGQASNGVWSDTISKYGSTTFTFSSPIYGFAGDFDISGANGLELIFSDGAQVSTPDGVYDGFFGVVGDGPISSVTLTWGQNPGCYECFGNSYTLSGLEVATDPMTVPEPNYMAAFSLLLLFLGGFSFVRKAKAKEAVIPSVEP